MRNLGSKEGLGVEFKTTYVPNCFSSSGLKATSIFIILLSRDGFERDCPETKVPNNHFLKSSQK